MSGRFGRMGARSRLSAGRRRARPSGAAGRREGGNGRDARRAPPRPAWSAAAMFALLVLVIAGGRTADERRGAGHRGERGQPREGGKKHKDVVAKACAREMGAGNGARALAARPRDALLDLG